MRQTEVAVIGGGLVGMAIAYGLQRRGKQVSVFDEDDRAFRASRGNFGLVWVQGKGATLPDYARWTRLSAGLWPEFESELRDQTGIDMELSQPGGIDICLSDAEANTAVQRLQELRAALDGDYPFEFLDRAKLLSMAPEIGPKVVGATYCPEDGHTNPLYLLRSLYQAFASRGGKLVNGGHIDKVVYQNPGFCVTTKTDPWQAQQIVLCAGLGNATLAPMVGLRAPVRPNRGQVLVTERLRRILRYPSVQIRQVGEGAVQIGDSKEDVGFDDGTNPRVISKIARRAIQTYPFLENIRMVRSWGALRVMSPDGHPIYDQSADCPGAFVVTCHSGVTLAAAHTLVLAGWIAGDPPPTYLESFGADRPALQTPA